MLGIGGAPAVPEEEDFSAGFEAGNQGVERCGQGRAPGLGVEFIVSAPAGLPCARARSASRAWASAESGSRKAQALTTSSRAAT